jgi:hypothetical protein
LQVVQPDLFSSLSGGIGTIHYPLPSHMASQIGGYCRCY